MLRSCKGLALLNTGKARLLAKLKSEIKRDEQGLGLGSYTWGMSVSIFLKVGEKGKAGVY